MLQSDQRINSHWSENVVHQHDIYQVSRWMDTKKMKYIFNFVCSSSQRVHLQWSNNWSECQTALVYHRFQLQMHQAVHCQVWTFYLETKQVQVVEIVYILPRGYNTDRDFTIYWMLLFLDIWKARHVKNINAQTGQVKHQPGWCLMNKLSQEQHFAIGEFMWKHYGNRNENWCLWYHCLYFSLRCIVTFSHILASVIQASILYFSMLSVLYI